MNEHSCVGTIIHRAVGILTKLFDARNRVTLKNQNTRIKFKVDNFSRALWKASGTTQRWKGWPQYIDKRKHLDTTKWEEPVQKFTISVERCGDRVGKPFAALRQVA